MSLAVSSCNSPNTPFPTHTSWVHRRMQGTSRCSIHPRAWSTYRSARAAACSAARRCAGTSACADSCSAGQCSASSCRARPDSHQYCCKCRIEAGRPSGDSHWCKQNTKKAIQLSVLRGLDCNTSGRRHPPREEHRRPSHTCEPLVDQRPGSRQLAASSHCQMGSSPAFQVGPCSKRCWLHLEEGHASLPQLCPELGWRQWLRVARALPPAERPASDKAERQTLTGT